MRWLVAGWVAVSFGLGAVVAYRSTVPGRASGGPSPLVDAPRPVVAREPVESSRYVDDEIAATVRNVYLDGHL